MPGDTTVLTTTITAGLTLCGAELLASCGGGILRWDLRRIRYPASADRCAAIAEVLARLAAERGLGSVELVVASDLQRRIAYELAAWVDGSGLQLLRCETDALPRRAA